MSHKDNPKFLDESSIQQHFVWETQADESSKAHFSRVYAYCFHFTKIPCKFLELTLIIVANNFSQGFWFFCIPWKHWAWNKYTGSPYNSFYYQVIYWMLSRFAKKKSVKQTALKIHVGWRGRLGILLILLNLGLKEVTS